MAFPKSFVASFLLIMLVMRQVESNTVDSQLIGCTGRSLLQTKPVPLSECPSRCSVRCSKSWKQKMCKKLCNVCCGKCQCVPEGTTAEARKSCACYANMKAPNGKYKCP